MDVRKRRFRHRRRRFQRQKHNFPRGWPAFSISKTMFRCRKRYFWQWSKTVFSTSNNSFSEMRRKQGVDDFSLWHRSPLDLHHKWVQFILHAKCRLWPTKKTECSQCFQFVFEVFCDAFKVFPIFFTFSEVWGPVRTCSDAFGRVQMRPDALGCIRTLSDIFRNFWNFKNVRPKSTLNNSRIDPESTPNLPSRIDPESIPNQPRKKKESV